MHQIDLRSDTVTQPTAAMRRAMAEAVVGDDCYGDDLTVKKLERMAAEATGKEAALFVPTGTFGNQLALFVHCRRADEVILDDGCHIVTNEMGASAVIPGVQLRTVTSEAGMMPLSEIERRIRRGGLHSPRTGLICLENAHSCGEALPLEYMQSVRELARANGLPLHLDGARLFNAAEALGTPPRALAGCADTVMFCLSKGLCAPVGSLLAGPEEFIAQAREKRQLMGGGMRQCGVLAAAGIVALDEMTGRLGEDREKAGLLAGLLAEAPDIELRARQQPTNILFFRSTRGGGLAESLAPRGILLNPPQGGWYRVVTHRDVSFEDIRHAAASIIELDNR